jgi:hypothetical protein
MAMHVHMYPHAVGFFILQLSFRSPFQKFIEFLFNCSFLGIMQFDLIL